MSRTGRRPRAAAAAALLLLPAPAWANLRAPVVVPAAPSGALSGPPGVAVRGETLRVDCEAECEVRASYRLVADAAGHASFEFVLPVERPVSVALGPQALAVAVEPTRPDPKSSHGPAEPPTYVARFAADLAAGETTVEVSYRQPLASVERGHGYFSKGRFVRSFEYVLGPLKQWRLEPAFTLEVVVSMPREEPGWWKRTFGHPPAIACVDAAGGAGPALAGEGAQRGGRYELALTLRGREFPDRLRCLLAEADLLPGG